MLEKNHCQRLHFFHVPEKGLSPSRRWLHVISPLPVTNACRWQRFWLNSAFEARLPPPPPLPIRLGAGLVTDIVTQFPPNFHKSVYQRAERGAPCRTGSEKRGDKPRVKDLGRAGHSDSETGGGPKRKKVSQNNAFSKLWRRTQTITSSCITTAFHDVIRVN